MKIAELRELIAGVVKEQMAQFVPPRTQVEAVVQQPPQHAFNLPGGKSALGPGIGLGRYVLALAATKGNGPAAMAWADQRWGTGNETSLALGTQTIGAGGALVPQVYSTDFIELLRPMSVVRRMNPIVVPVNAGNLTFGKLTGGATASYGAENKQTNASQPATGDLKLVFHPLRCVVPISNSLIRYSSPNADTVVRDDALAAIALEEDKQFLLGDGLTDNPKGIRNWAVPGNVIPANGTVNLQNTNTDLGKLVLALKVANARMLRPGVIMSNRTEQYLLTVQNAQGFYTFRPEMLGGTLWKYPYAASNQVPDNIGGTDSEIFFADFADVVIGESTNVMVDASTEAAYNDSTGTLVSAYSRDQTVVRLIVENDIGMRHDASIAVLTGVTWAPGS